MYIKFEPGQKYAKKGAEISESHEVFTDCGYLLQENEIVIDIDTLSKEQIKRMIDYFEIKTKTVWTDRGAHLYFRKPVGFARAKNGPCALGFPIESKHFKNCPKGITVKRNGVLRDVDNEDELMELPWYFSYNRKFQDLTGLSDGEGRNNALFAHKALLDNKEDSNKVLRFINAVIFAEPLDEKELETICRQYAFDSGTGGQEFAIANEIINQFNCVTYQGTIWCFDGTRYYTDVDDRRLKRIIYDRCPGKNTRFVDEVIKQISYRAEDHSVEAYPIKLKNGIIADGIFIPVKNYHEFTPYYIDIAYKEDAEVVLGVDDYINAITNNDENYRKLLLEAMGYVFITDPEVIRRIGQFFILRGDGANGKGSLLQIMSRIFGQENCSALSIKEMVDTRFQVSMIGKLANLGDDVEPEAINNKEMKALKNMATADTIETRFLYKQSFRATFTAKLFFTTNADLRTFEKGYAYKRRAKWLPMFNKVEHPDPRFISKMTTKEALEYWIRLLVEAYGRLYQNGKLTESEVVNEYNNQYHIENNYMEVFLQTLDIERDVIGKTGPEIKELYREYNDDDSKKYSPKLFADALKERGIGRGIKKVDGRSIRVYMKQDDTQQEVL